MEYLAAHAGYSRVHNPRTGEKDLVRLPGLVAIAYQHETSRCGDPHLHTHVIVPNRRPARTGKRNTRGEPAANAWPPRLKHMPPASTSTPAA
jgi:hypothetical protein